jgi:transcriptional regulator
MARSPQDLLQGTLDLMILKALSWGPRHGYAISNWITAHAGGELAIEEAALYKALHRLEQAGHLAAEWGRSENQRRARFYRLAAGGRRELTRRASVWVRYRDSVERILAATSAEVPA